TARTAEPMAMACPDTAAMATAVTATGRATTVLTTGRSTSCARHTGRAATTVAMIATATTTAAMVGRVVRGLGIPATFIRIRHASAAGMARVQTGPTAHVRR